MKLDITLTPVALTVAASLAVAAPQDMFPAPMHHPAGTHPLAVQAGDLDADGHLDLVVADRGPDDLHVYFGDGAGALLGPVTYAGCSDTRDVELADVDEDGDLDAVTVCAWSGRMAVFLNDGLGSLAAPNEYMVSQGIQHLALADIDQDGDQDACVTRYYQGDVAVLLNDGAGAFFVASYLPLPMNGADVELCDLDHDGMADVVTTANSGGAGTLVSVFMGDGQGGFGPRTDFTAGASDISGITCADLDRDGNSDVAVSSAAGAVFLSGDGTGQLGPFQHLASPAWNGPCTDVHAADLDGDGTAELIAVAQDAALGDDGMVTTFSFDPPGGWENDGDYPLGLDAAWGGVVAADLDEDGFRELVVCGYHSGMIAVLDHAGTDCDGDGLYDPEAIEDGAVPDADGDGVPDACQCSIATYCETSPNSVGAGALIGWSGSSSLGRNDLVLVAAGLPPGQTGLFFAGPSAIDPVPFGEGWICVGGPLARLEPPLVVRPDGTVVRAVDFTSVPLWPITVGDTRCFQFWYRDPCMGCAGWNLTDAMCLTVCP